jgi:hypothetical protein
MIFSLTARILTCTSRAHTSVSYSSKLHEEIRCCICKLWLRKLSSPVKKISQGHFIQLFCYATQIARGFLESYVTEIWNFWIVNNPSRWIARLLYVPVALTLKNLTICPHSVFVFFMDLTETTIISLCDIRLLFLQMRQLVYGAVRTETMYNVVYIYFRPRRENGTLYSPSWVSVCSTNSAPKCKQRIPSRTHKAYISFVDLE